MSLLGMTILGATACKKNIEESDLKLTGGREEHLVLPATVGLTSQLPNIGTNKPAVVCGGTFISDRVLLTSAACILLFRDDIKSRQSTGVQILSEDTAFKDKIVSSDLMIIHPEYANGLAGGSESSSDLIDYAYIDLGVIIFPANTASGPLIASLAKTSHDVGSSVQLVGWGDNFKPSGTMRGSRHYGHNKINAIDSTRQNIGTITGVKSSAGETSSDFEMAMLALNDKGTGIYNEKNELIGVASKIDEQAESNPDAGDSHGSDDEEASPDSGAHTGHQTNPTTTPAANPSINEKVSASFSNLTHPLSLQFVEAVLEKYSSSGTTHTNSSSTSSSFRH